MKQEQGMTLIVVLLMLLIITSLAGTSIYSATVQERMANNLQVKTQLFIEAENRINQSYQEIESSARSTAILNITKSTGSTATNNSRSHATVQKDSTHETKIAPGFDLSVAGSGMHYVNIVIESTAWQDADASGGTAPTNNEISTTHSQGVSILSSGTL
ncbi:PilX N-terminal domain-containing pilus assembly protein [Parendozoicomonas haliclonae]|uniref:Type 4 fimbrial biogenesis protein PilX N-terminal domain-containing protein n=1 Tax=Parendozoicomonas haliclonae TaxID=1960125 RepID=A0A1X7AQK8_9GAMM|nr:PilX N-terminal domain-containing pilus assembly protein [Parendozoicomonas haliclonae]SMA50379.1 hypothetical protein EHSB41UT_04176 [Parendozoicomonas haliclonae]